MNYDAKGVADILGVAFDAGAGDDASLRPQSAPPRSSGRGSTPRAHDIAASPPTQRLIEQAVELGLPRTSLRHLAAWLAGGDAGKIAELEWGIVPKTTLDRRATRLSPQESERTERVARLAAQASRALGSAPEARAFMLAPHAELDGRTPLEAARSDLGARRAEQILNALEYGLAL